MTETARPVFEVSSAALAPNEDPARFRTLRGALNKARSLADLSGTATLRREFAVTNAPFVAVTRPIAVVRKVDDHREIEWL